jgi:integrase
VESLLARPESAWIGHDLEQKAHRYAITHVVPEHVAEVKERKLELLDKTDIVIKNVAQNVELPEATYVERAILELGDVKTLLGSTKETELEAIVPTAIGTGLRRSELCALRWTDIDLGTGTIHVRRAAALLDGKIIIKAPKTKGSQRTDHLPAFVLEILVRHKAEQLENLTQITTEFEARRRQRDGYVFIRRNGDPWNPNELSRQFSRLVRRKKLPLFRFHDLRHGFASLAFAAGVPLKVVSDSLGHSGIGITAQTYVHLLADQKREKAAALDTYLDSAVRPVRSVETAS